jgi:methyl-accepting chemotaxis protein
MFGLSIRTRFAIAGVLMGGAVALVGMLGLQGMFAAKEGLRAVYEDRVVPLKQLKHVADAYAVSVIDAVNKANAGMMTAEEALKGVREARRTIHAEWTQYLSTTLTVEEKTLSGEVGKTMAAADKAMGDLEVFLASRSGSLEGKLNGFDGELYATIDPVSNQVSELVDVQLRVAQQTYDVAAADFEHKRLVVTTIGVAASIAAAVIGFLLYRGIVPPMLKLAGQMREITAGNINLQVDSDRSDELGDVVTAFRALFSKVNADFEEATRKATENERIKQALEGTSTNVMVADPDGKILFMNQAVTEMMRRNETGLCRELPALTSVNDMVGSNFDIFHKNPSHQRNLLATLKATHKTQIKLGGMTFALAASPIADGSGTRIGTVLEWVDRTQEVMAEEEIARAVNAAAAGDFSIRMSVDGKQGFLLSMVEGLNRVLQASETGLNEVSRVTQSLARGDLTQSVTGEFEGQFASLQADTNASTQKLRELIGQVQESVESITTASKEIAAGNADLSGRTEEQASSLEETASSMEELTSTVKQNAENARQANQLVVGTADVAVRGGAVVQQVVSTMGEISESSKKIADIISVIDGIAFQTNILALNAAVEAARAGEQGRGFAVVATEVRNLAQRSAAAAKEIKELISDSVGKVESGSKLVDEAGRTMDEIVASVKRVTDIMAEIAAASIEQSSGIEQVNQAITQMDEATQQNAALVEEAAAAAESLEEQAQVLSQAVSVFKVTGSAVGGGRRDDQWDTQTERRGPDRAKNVARLPKAAPAKKAGKSAAKPAAKASRVVGGADAEGEWEDF